MISPNMSSKPLRLRQQLRAHLRLKKCYIIIIKKSRSASQNTRHDQATPCLLAYSSASARAIKPFTWASGIPAMLLRLCCWASRLSRSRALGGPCGSPTGDGGHHRERGGIGNAAGHSARARPISTWCSRGGREAYSSGGAIVGGACADLTRPNLWASRLGRMQSLRLVSGRA